MSESSQKNISFIIPVLNGEKYIRKCLKSIYDEKAENDEIIVIDNGSNDNTIQIIKEFNNVKLFEKPDSTIASLRNFGASKSGGEYLAFIDCDVLLCEGWRENVIRVLNNPQIHSTGSRYDIPEQPTWIEKAWYSQKIEKEEQAIYINSGNLIVKKEIFASLSGFDKSLITDEDYDFGERLKNAGYCMIEAPSVRSIHLGNPKTILAFYKKEKWHSTSSLAKISLKKVDKPTLMTIAFILSIAFALVSVFLAVFSDYRWVLGVNALAIVPLLTSIYRFFQYKKLRYLIEISILYFIFYLARASTIFSIIFKGI